MADLLHLAAGIGGFLLAVALLVGALWWADARDEAADQRWRADPRRPWNRG